MDDHRLRVLLVDDDETYCSVLGDALENILADEEVYSLLP